MTSDILVSYQGNLIWFMNVNFFMMNILDNMALFILTCRGMGGVCLEIYSTKNKACIILHITQYAWGDITLTYHPTANYVLKLNGLINLELVQLKR